MTDATDVSTPSAATVGAKVIALQKKTRTHYTIKAVRRRTNTKKFWEELNRLLSLHKYFI
jgi:hypothetical protein